MESIAIPIPEERLQAFCQRRGIARLSLFGSALRADFRSDSDVDLLVEFKPGVRHDLWDHYYMCEELQEIFGRRIDLVNKEALERSANPFRRHAILESAELIYAVR